MKSLCFSAAVIAGLAVSANGQATQTWVSGFGDDANPCSRTEPCHTWAGAISKTAPGGEIDSLDPGGFGGVTITKAITIDGTPFTSGATVRGSNGITINAGPTDVVTLRGLTINGANFAATNKGIQFNTGGALIVENCEIYGIGQRAISIQPSANDVNVTISDTTIRGNLSNGIVIQPLNGFAAKVALDNVHIRQNINYGVSVTAGGVVSVRNSVIDHNGLSGFRVDSAATLDLDNVEITGNLTGLESIAGSTTRLNNSSITQNGTGLVVGGTVQSYGTNRVAGNGSGNSGMSIIGVQ